MADPREASSRSAECCRSTASRSRRPYYAPAKTPITIVELVEAYLVNPLVDLHSPDWASWDGKLCTPPLASVSAERTGSD